MVEFIDNVEKPDTPEIDELSRAIGKYALQGEWVVDRHSRVLGAIETRSGEILIACGETVEEFALMLYMKDQWLISVDFDPPPEEFPTEPGKYMWDTINNKFTKVEE